MDANLARQQAEQRFDLELARLNETTESLGDTIDGIAEVSAQIVAMNHTNCPYCLGTGVYAAPCGADDFEPELCPINQ